MSQAHAPSGTPHAALSDADHRTQLRRAVLASTIGTTIEWYDFFLYSTVTGLVFAKLFFPNADPLVGTLEAFAGLCGRLRRPADRGGDLRPFRRPHRPQIDADRDPDADGHRHLPGRLVPAYASIGIWGAILLTVLRFIQGVGVGGEWGGSVLMSMEWARSNAPSRLRRVLAAVRRAGRAVPRQSRGARRSAPCSGDAFLAWGWRIPFLLSIVLVGIGLWIRLGILETPTFRRIVDEKPIERAPLTEVSRRHPKEIILSALARMAEQAPFYIFTAFVFSYGTATLHALARSAAHRGAGRPRCCRFVTMPLAGHLSDRFGRRRIYMIGAVLTGVFGFVYFAMLNTQVAGAGSSSRSCSR